MLTLEDIFAFQGATDVQLSPDGLRFAYVSGDNHTTLLPGDETPTGQPARISRSAIFLCDAAPGSEPRRLTSGPRGDSLPRWSPDGTSLAFLSDRAVLGQRQIYSLTVPRSLSALPEEGEDDGAMPLTSVKGDIPTPRGLNAVQWNPDGKSIAFLLEEQPATAADNEAAFGDDALEYEAHEEFVRVYRVDVVTGSLSVVSPISAGQVWEFAPGPGGQIAAVVSASPFEWSWYACRLVLFDDASGDDITELASPMREPKAATDVAQSRQVARNYPHANSIAP